MKEMDKACMSQILSTGAYKIAAQSKPEAAWAVSARTAACENKSR